MTLRWFCQDLELAVASHWRQLIPIQDSGMSDLRFDPVTNQWTTIARNRRERPIEFVPIEQVRKQLICPFCKGNEDETPPAYSAYRSDGSLLNGSDDPSNWTVRVVPNKYPMFPGPGSANGSLPGTSNGPYRMIDVSGEQELIVSSPRHVSSLSELTPEELYVSFRVYQHRIQYLSGLPHIKHAMLFMNCRYAAGASLSHIHTQLIGSPLISDALAGRCARNRCHYEQHDKTLIATLTDWEREQESRVIYESDHFVAYCPYASRFAFQTRIVPRTHFNCFPSAPLAMVNELADLCRRVVARLELLMDQPSYNMLLNIAPFELNQNDHWYFEIFPRLTRAAGYEWGTDIWVNPVSPETAAKQIRE